MNRTTLGLAIGAGYLLGRTKKLKMALAVGSLVAGKKLNLTPKGIADLVSQQLQNNPQFKEIGDQLRQDMRGVGKAATGAMVERQMNALADRLQGRTSQVRDQLNGVVSGSEDDEEREPRDEDSDDEEPREESRSGGDGDAPRKRPAKKAPARKSAEKSADKPPAKKAAAKKTTAARKTAAKKTASARGTASRRPKGGDDR
ncbi:DNA primase [Streptomyces sp. LP11]|uniref:DNA primase n=1 Tax=Streptomyces pyxinicus TaxID=2970331 RepID=A0ABT2AUP8_9ACTN|nr:DNA primase [Streptomyces sp. LP11]MCS0599982.1 DNA primase [Streptomyces sp. LP11]